MISSSPTRCPSFRSAAHERHCRARSPKYAWYSPMAFSARRSRPGGTGGQPLDQLGRGWRRRLVRAACIPRFDGTALIAAILACAVGVHVKDAGPQVCACSWSPFRFVGAIRPPDTAQDIHARLSRVHAPCNAPSRLRIRIGLGAVVGDYGYDFPPRLRLADRRLDLGQIPFFCGVMRLASFRRS